MEYNESYFQTSTTQNNLLKASNLMQSLSILYEGDHESRVTVLSMA
jgi:hypothetical protein